MLDKFKTRFQTAWVIVAVVVVLIGWDIYAFKAADPDGTISEVILGAAKRHTIVPFLFGVLMGHFFWPQVENGQVPK